MKKKREMNTPPPEHSEVVLVMVLVPSRDVDFF